MKQLERFDFHSGVKIPLAELEAMKNICFDAVKDRNKFYASSATGKALVIASKNSDGTIEMYVIENGYVKYIYE